MKRVKQVDHEGINGFELPEPYHGWRSLQPLLNSLSVPAWEFPNLMQLEAAAMAVSRAPCIVMEVRCNCMSTRATEANVFSIFHQFFVDMIFDECDSNK